MSNKTAITKIQGDVQVMKAGQSNWVKAQIELVLQPGDSIKTGDNSEAIVTFFEGSTVELKADTQIEVSQLAKSSGIGPTTINLKQQIGDTVNTVKKLTDSASGYDIQTPSAVAGVRGSIMLVSVVQDGTTKVTNEQGNIYVIGSGVEVNIPVGTTSIVKPGQVPEPPVPVTTSAVNKSVFSATASYSTTNGNPNGSWSYGWMLVDFSVFNIYTTHNSFQWYGGLGSDLTPLIWINNQAMAYGVPTGWLSIHPGPGTQPSILRWTAPTSGDIRIVGQFLPGDAGIMQVDIRHNNEEIWKSTDSGSFDLSAHVAAGDTIDFAVFGGYGYGNTPISATISYGVHHVD